MSSTLIREAAAESFVIEGGRRLGGRIRAAGNKNGALPIMAACLLTDEPVLLTNVPRIRDIETMGELLQQLGADVEWTGPNEVRVHAAELTTHGQPPGTRNRRALVIAGDDERAKSTVAQLIDQFGFDVVDAGPLAEGWRIQRDTPGYGPRRAADELRRDLAAAKRYALM